MIICWNLEQRSGKRETSLAKKWEEPSMHQTKFHNNGIKNKKGEGEGCPNSTCMLQKISIVLYVDYSVTSMLERCGILEDSIEIHRILVSRWYVYVRRGRKRNQSKSHQYKHHLYMNSSSTEY